MTKYIVAVDPTVEPTTVAIGPEKVSDPAHVTVREYSGLGAEDAFQRLLSEGTVDAADMLFVVVVAEPDTSGAAGRRLPDGLRAAVGPGRVSFLDRRDAKFRCRLAGAPGAAASVGAVLSLGDYGRGEAPAVDPSAVEALVAADPVGFERWVVTAVGGFAIESLGDQGVDGLIWRPRDTNGKPGQLVIVVKAGDPVEARVVDDLVAAVRAQDAAGGLLITMTDPSPEVQDAARRTGPSPWRTEDGVPFVQTLTIPEVLDGKRPAGVAA